MSTQQPWGPQSDQPHAPAAPAYGGYPGYPQGGPIGFGLAMKRRVPLGVWLGLPLITLGIYSLVWYYKVNKEIAEFDSRRHVSPVGALLAITIGGFVIIPPFVSVFNTGKRIAEAQRAAGLTPTCSAGIGLLLMFVLGLYPLYYQIELNKIVDHYNQATPGTQVPLAY
ncbi:DUF4234 domain-containing protein [Streptomyces varsoviensis]|uniref:DUF4234 domain-containing protein n=1 Tax=Streptomyces varsoviensis TaxID=67373 RepID=UPI003409533F